MNKCIVCDAKIFTNHGKIKNGDYAKKFLNDYSLKICKKCGLSFIYPVPPDEVLKVIYSNPEYSAWSTAELTDRTNIRFSNFIYYFNIIIYRKRKDFGLWLRNGILFGYCKKIALIHMALKYQTSLSQ